MTGAGFLHAVPSEARDIPTKAVVIRRRRSGNARWARQLAAGVAIGTVLLVPFPAAGNHPLPWALWTLVFAMVAALLSRFSLFSRDTPSGPVRPIMWLGIACVGFAIFQALPLPALGGGAVALALPNTSITTAHLSVAPGATWLAALRITGYLIFFQIVLFAGRDPRQAKRIGSLLFFGVAAHGFLALVSLFLLGDQGLVGEKTAFFGAATGAFVNKNSFATFLGMGLILGLSLGGHPGAPIRLPRWVGQAALAITFIALLMTQSRMGIAATLGGAALVVLTKGPGGAKKTLLLLPAVLLALLLIPLLFQSGFFDLRVSAQTRSELYRQIVPMIAQRPLIGYGIDSFALAFEPFHRGPLTAEFIWDKGHSTYLTLWAEAGILFGSFPPLAGFLAFRALWNRAQQAKRGQSMARAGAGILVLGGLHSLGDFSLEIHANVILTIAIVALGLAGHQKEKGVRDDPS